MILNYEQKRKKNRASFSKIEVARVLSKIISTDSSDGKKIGNIGIEILNLLIQCNFDRYIKIYLPIKIILASCLTLSYRN